MVFSFLLEASASSCQWVLLFMIFYVAYTSKLCFYCSVLTADFCADENCTGLLSRGLILKQLRHIYGSQWNFDLTIDKVCSLLHSLATLVIYIYQSHPKELWIVELCWVAELITAGICYPLWALALTAIHCLQHWLCEIKSSYRDLPGTFAVWRVHSWKSFTPNEPRLSRYNSSTRKCRPEENRKNGTSFLAVLHVLFV